MPTRDKLAQLLMVGVTDAADARTVVDTQHVGGIMIGSWTDLSMLSDGSLGDITATAGPLPLAVSVDEEGGRVSSAVGSDRYPAHAARAGADQHPGPGLRNCARPGPQDARPGYHHRLRAGRRRHRRPRRHRDRRPVVRVGSRCRHRLRGGLRPRPSRRGCAASAQALPRPRSRVGRFARGQCRHPTAG